MEQTFGEGTLGPFVRHMVASYAPGEAAPALERTRRAFADCPVWTGAYQGQTFTFRVSPVDVSALGDESFALRLSADGPVFLRAESLLVFVRRQDAAFLLAYTAAGFGGATIDRALTEELARRADARLRAALDDR